MKKNAWLALPIIICSALVNLFLWAYNEGYTWKLIIVNVLLLLASVVLVTSVDRYLEKLGKKDTDTN